jgi:NAD(P)-dependent dehydrogenase (short-subunit alcohol dehydrogenase family)
VTTADRRGPRRSLEQSGNSHGVEIGSVSARPLPTRVDTDIRRLVARIRRKSGHLDILVNNAFGGEDGRRHIYSYDVFPFWKHDFDEWWYRLFTAYLRSTLATTFYALPLMLRRRDALIVNTLWWNRGRYLWDLFFDLGSNGVGRMVYGLDLELRTRRISAVGLSPGWTLTEGMAHLSERTKRKLASPVRRASCGIPCDGSGSSSIVGESLRDRRTGATVRVPQCRWSTD